MDLIFGNMYGRSKIRVFAWRACQNILPTHENCFAGKWFRMSFVSDVTKPLNQFFMCFRSAVQCKTCGQVLQADCKKCARSRGILCSCLNTCATICPRKSLSFFGFTAS